MGLLLLFDGPSKQALTLSGNEITDASRAAGLEGDGLLNDSSFGIWEAATNLCTNGGFETNTTGWIAWKPEASISRVTTQSKFGSASLEVVVTDLGSRGTRVTVSLSATTVYTFSAWVKVPTGATVRIAVYDTPVTTELGGVNVVGDDDWQHASVTFTSDGDGGTHNFFIMTYADYNAVTFYVDGVQIEAQPVATPYIETDGGTATRSAARVQAPASLLDETQGWVAMRFRPGWGAATEMGGGTEYPHLFYWADDANNFIDFIYAENTNALGGGRKAGGVGATYYAVRTLTQGVPFTVIAAWTATTVGYAFDGGAFSTAANTSIPTLSAATFDIFNKAGTLQFNGDVIWAAFGTGTLTNADSATIHAFGDADRGLEAFPGNPTGFWSANTNIMEVQP